MRWKTWKIPVTLYAICIHSAQNIFSIEFCLILTLDELWKKKHEKSNLSVIYQYDDYQTRPQRKLCISYTYNKMLVEQSIFTLQWKIAPIILYSIVHIRRFYFSHSWHMKEIMRFEFGLRKNSMVQTWMSKLEVCTCANFV